MPPQPLLLVCAEACGLTAPVPPGLTLPHPRFLVCAAACVQPAWNVFGKLARGRLEVAWICSSVRERRRLGWRDIGSLTALTITPLQSIGIVLRAMPSSKSAARAALVVLAALGLAGCSAERPPYPPAADRFADLRVALAPPAPAPRSDETEDEAEIQFRAAFVFYRRGQWDYAVPAFAEVVDYDDARDDARYYWAAALVMADRNEEALPVLRDLLETAFEMPARALLARVLFRQGKLTAARAAAAPAAKENFDAAGWLARYDLLSE